MSLLSRYGCWRFFLRGGLLSGLFHFRRFRLKLGAFDIRTALANLNIDRFGTARFQRGCCLALESDLLGLRLTLTVILFQIGQQLLLLITGNRISFGAGFQASLHDLSQQTIHGSAYICGQLFYRYISHTGPPPD